MMFTCNEETVHVTGYRSANPTFSVASCLKSSRFEYQTYLGITLEVKAVSIKLLINTFL